MLQKPKLDSVDRLRFSERNGYKKVREVLQIEAIDEALKNSLWNLLTLSIWDKVRSTSGYDSGVYLSNPANKEIQTLCKRLWWNYFKKPLDQLDDEWRTVHFELREYFFECNWYELYDEGGIRHALLEAEATSFEEAIFFLVSCSAFINFVKAKDLKEK